MIGRFIAWVRRRLCRHTSMSFFMPSTSQDVHRCNACGDDVYMPHHPEGK